MRAIVTIEGLAKVLPLTPSQIYKLIRDPVHPLPFKKCNKRLLFDLERVFHWFDNLPGARP